MDEQAAIEQIKAEKALLKERLLQLSVSEVELKKSRLNHSLNRKEKSTFTLSDAKLMKKMQRSFKNFEKEITKKAEVISIENEALK